jgi:hypothetical protein
METKNLLTILLWILFLAAGAIAIGFIVSKLS